MNKMWYEVDITELHDSLYKEYERLSQENASRIMLMKENLAMYDNDLSQIGDDEVTRALRMIEQPEQLNVCQSLVETVKSNLGASKPGVRLLPSDADWSLRHTVKKLNSFLVADWQRIKLHKQIREVVKDALIYGTGFLKPFNANNRFQAERAIPTSILIDDRDALYNDPKNFIQVRHIPRNVLKANFPESVIDIENASTISYLQHESLKVTELVTVIEAWHVPINPGDRGRHSIVIDQATLYDDQEYDNHLGPFVTFKWITRPEGFWGLGIVDQVKGIQLQIDKLLLNIARAINLTSKPTMFIQGSSNISPEQIDNDRDRFTIIYHQGNKPITEYHSGVNAELVNYLSYLYAKAYEITGVSELNATSKKPGGLNSGVALRNYADITSQRFLAAENDLHDFYVDVAHQTIYNAKQIADNNDNYKVEVSSDDIYTTIDWKEIQKAENQYIIRPLPVSDLGNTFSGKLEKVQELMQAGLIDPQIGLELLNLPDLERYNNLYNAKRNLARKVVESIIDEAKYTAPSDLFDVQYAYEHASQHRALLEVENKNIPDENLELLDMFISECVKIIEAKQMQQMQMQQPPIPQG